MNALMFSLSRVSQDIVPGVKIGRRMAGLTQLSGWDFLVGSVSY